MSPLHITLGNKDRPLLFSIAAIEELEIATGKTIVQLLGTPNFDVGLTTLVTMVHVGVKHGGEGNLTRDRIRTMVDRDFDAGRLTLKGIIDIVQHALLRSSALRSMLPAEVLADLDDSEKKLDGGGGGPLASDDGASASNPISTS